MKSLNILCATDNNYVPYCGIMLTSLFENNKDTMFNIFVLTAGLNKQNIDTLKELAKTYKQNIELINIDNNMLEGCPIKEGDHISIAAYYRILAPMLLPANIDKILYLDCDIIINGSIKKLYNTDIENHALSAVIDEDYFGKEKYQRLNIPYNKNYINSGVLLLNLKYWRENNVMEQCFEYIQKNPGKILLHDQDTLNVVLQNQIKYLPITYNFQTGFIYKNAQLDTETLNEVHNFMYAPAIIHYTGIGKPWYAGCMHPYKNKFLYYQNTSLWKKNALIDNRTIKEKTIHFIYRIMCFLKIKKRPQTYIIGEQKQKS